MEECVLIWFSVTNIGKCNSHGGVWLTLRSVTIIEECDLHGGVWLTCNSALCKLRRSRPQHLLQLFLSILNGQIWFPWVLWGPIWGPKSDWGPSGTYYPLKTSQNCSKTAHFSFISVRLLPWLSTAPSLVSVDAGSLPKVTHTICQGIQTRISTFIFIFSELEQFPWI